MEWPAGRVSPLNIPAWRSFPLRERLQARFPAIPVRVHNDAICMAVGEHWRGAGRGRRSMLGMVVSTGVGGGLVLDGRLINGATGNAGHIGHVVVDPGGPFCTCGPVGIAALRRAGQALGIAIASAVHLCDLEVVAIGGGLAQAGPLLFGPLEEALRTHAGLDYASKVPVVAAALGQSAGLIGAAALILAADRYWAGD
jgi:glucokinase